MTIQKFIKQFKNLHIIAYSTDKSKYFARDNNYKAHYIYDAPGSRTTKIQHSLQKCSSEYQNWFKDKLDLTLLIGFESENYDVIRQDEENFTPCHIDYDEGAEEWIITNDSEEIIMAGFKSESDANSYAATNNYRKLEKQIKETA